MKYCLTACSRSRCTEKADIYRVLWKAVRLFRRPVRADSVLGALVLPVKIVAAAGQHGCLLMGRARPRCRGTSQRGGAGLVLAVGIPWAVLC